MFASSCVTASIAFDFRRTPGLWGGFLDLGFMVISPSMPVKRSAQGISYPPDSHTLAILEGTLIGAPHFSEHGASFPNPESNRSGCCVFQ